MTGLTNMDLRHRLSLAEHIAMEASNVAMAHFRKPLDVSAKSDDSPVTVADQATERFIRDAIAAELPSDAIFGEEFGQSGDGAGTWIIDPIDGTRSFITGMPLFGMLIGYLLEGRTQLAIINMPALQEMYSGATGLGAMLNGASIQVSECTDLNDARIFINEGDKLAKDQPEVFGQLVGAGAVRRMAADCYPHALVASGHADCVVDYDLQPYDYLPVSAVVEAAGGVMTDWDGAPLTMDSDGKTLTAATPQLHAALLELVNA